jgi:hypothetical protein
MMVSEGFFKGCFYSLFLFSCFCCKANQDSFSIDNFDVAQTMSFERICQKAAVFEKTFKKEKMIRNVGIMLGIISIFAGIGAFYWYKKDHKKDRKRWRPKKKMMEKQNPNVLDDGSFFNIVQEHAKKGLSLAVVFFVAKIVADLLCKGKRSAMSFIKKIFSGNNGKKELVRQHIFRVRDNLFEIQNFCYLYREREELQKNEFYFFELLELKQIFIINCEVLLAFILAFARYIGKAYVCNDIKSFCVHCNHFLLELSKDKFVSLKAAPVDVINDFSSKLQKMNHMFFSFISMVVNNVVA